MELVCTKCKHTCKPTSIHFEYPKMQGKNVYELNCVCDSCKRVNQFTILFDPKMLKLKMKSDGDMFE